MVCERSGMITNILLGLIFVALCFIGLMVYAIGEKISEKQK